MSRKWSTRRKSLAIGLAVVGVAGLSLASASQLTMNWGTQTFQAGNVTVKTDCQTDPISVTYDAPTFANTQAVPWTVPNVNFTNVDHACDAKSFQVAYRVGTAGQWVNVTATAGTVSAPSTTSASNAITAALPAGVDPSTITDWSLTIYS